MVSFTSLRMKNIAVFLIEPRFPVKFDCSIGFGSTSSSSYLP